MIELLDEEEVLINKLNNSSLVKEIKVLKETIIKDKLINTDNIYELNRNPIIHKYIEKVNELDLYIYYINSNIKSLINNKTCRSNNESNKW